jgi:hypothetical protein
VCWFRKLLSGSIIGAALSFSNSLVFAQIVIDDAPLARQEILSEVPIIGYRQFPEQAIVALDPKENEWVVDGKIFYSAAENDADLLAKSGKTAAEIKSLSLEQILELYRKRARNNAPECDQHEGIRVCRGSPAVNVVQVQNSSPHYDATLDPQVVRLAFDFGKLKSAKVVPMVAATGERSWGVTIDADYAKQTKHLYTSVDVVWGGTQDPDKAFAFSKSAKVVWNKPLSQETALLISKIALGKPLIFPAKEKKLQIEPSISQVYDAGGIHKGTNGYSGR